MNQKSNYQPAPAGAIAAPRTVEQTSSFLNGAPAGDLMGFKPARSLPSELKYSYSNATGSSKNLMIFDPIGAVASASGLAVVAGTPGAFTNDIVNKYIAANPIMFAGFRIEVTSTAQLNESVKFYSVDYDESMNVKPINLESHVTGTKYDETIQYYRTPFVVNSLVGLVFSVLDGQTVNITFAPSAEFLRI